MLGEDITLCPQSRKNSIFDPPRRFLGWGISYFMWQNFPGERQADAFPSLDCLLIPPIKMSPIEDRNDGDRACQNSTWIVGDMHLEDMNESSNFDVSNWSQPRTSPLFHTACALLLASYLAPTYSRWEVFTCTLFNRRSGCRGYSLSIEIILSLFSHHILIILP